MKRLHDLWNTGEMGSGESVRLLERGSDRWIGWLGPTALAALMSACLIVLDRSFWLDEAYSVDVADRTVGGILDMVIKTDAVYSVAYYFALHAWSDGLGLGYSTHAVRAFSATCAVAAVPVTYAIARRLLDSRTATLAVAFLAASPMFAHYATEARGYGLVLLATVLAVYSYLRYLEGNVRWLSGYVIAGAIGAMTHWFVLLVLVSVCGVAAWGHRRSAVRGVQLAATCGGTFIAVVPMAALFAIHARNASTFAQLGWIQEPSWSQLHSTIGALVGAPGIIALPFVVLVGLGVKHLAVLVRFWLVGPLVIAWLASYVQPMFVDRYLIVVLPAMCIALACGVRAMPAPAQLRGAVAILTIALAGVFAFATRPPDVRWDALATAVSRGDEPVVRGWGEARLPLGYYAKQHDGLAERLAWVDEIAGVDRIWFVGTTDGLWAAESEANRRAIEADGFHPLTVSEFGRRLTATLYARA